MGRTSADALFSSSVFASGAFFHGPRPEKPFKLLIKMLNQIFDVAEFIQIHSSGKGGEGETRPYRKIRSDVDGRTACGFEMGTPELEIAHLFRSEHAKQKPAIEAE
jgi:hypothetical protein